MSSVLPNHPYSDLQDAGVKAGPSQQGQLSSCVAHALGKAVCAAGMKNNPPINFLQEDAISLCVQLGGDKAATRGSLPDNLIWRGKHILLKEDGVAAGAPGGLTYKATFTRIGKCSSDDYDQDKLYVLVCQYKPDQSLRHCVYVTGRGGTQYSFWNSHGDQKDEEKIEVNKLSNQLYQVEVKIEELQSSNGSSSRPGATPLLTLTREEKEEQLIRMGEIMVTGIKRICSAQNGFDETFAEDIGVKEDYKDWLNDAGRGKMMKLKVKQILSIWAEENAEKATPKNMYEKLNSKAYNQIKYDLKNEFQFA